MRNQFHLSSRCRLFSLALLGCACATLPARQGRAQTAASAPIPSNGINVIETTGVYPAGTAGSDHFLDIGAAGTFPSFAVLDFTASSFALTAPVTNVSNLTLSVTEANYTGSKAGTFAIYLSEDTNSIATANNGSPLKYDTTQAPGGLGTQLGDPNAASPTLFQIGTFTSSATTVTNTPPTADTFTLTLTSAAQAYFDQQLNAGASGDIRLVLASTNASGYATFNGNTSAVATAYQPTLAFSATLNQPTLAWTPGGSANNNGGPGTWLPAGTAGDTSWNGGPWNNSYTAVYGGTGGAVTIGAGGVSAQGIQFNATGYTLGTNGGPAITLTTGGVVQVTTAANTDTINAPIAGTVGLNKTGAGTLVLGGTNTYTGTTTVTGGTLQVSSNAAFGAAGNNVALAGGTLSSGVTNGTLALTRGITGSGSINVATGTTLSTSGVVTAGALTLPGGGTVLLTNTNSNTTDGANHAFSSVTFQTGGAALQTQNAGISGTGVTAGLGIADLGGLTANNAAGSSVTFAANASVTGTVPISVTNAGATLSLPGAVASAAAALAKTGAGLLVLGGDNSGLAGGTTATAAFLRQGTAGTSPATGGVVSIPASNPNPNYALGTGQYQANGGTLSNDTGAPITLAVNSISSGASTNIATPGGTVFAGNGAITVTGNVSLYKASSTTTSYQHGMTFNTPTTFTGLFTVSTGTVNSTGLTIAGSSTLTMSGTAGANTFVEPVTIATANTGGVILAKDGAFGANTMITINSAATLTINTGVTTGTVDAINNAALLQFQAVSGAFGKLALSIGTATETIGGLYLAAGDGTLQAGYQKAGTYGPTGSGATYIDNNLFSGAGVVNNLGTATLVPEPSAWAILALGGVLAGWVTRLRRKVI